MKKKYKNKSVKKIVIPNGTSSIPDFAFMWNTDVTEVVIPDSVIHIGENAFLGCSNLVRVRMSRNLRLTGKRVFADCVSLKEITIPNSLQYINEEMFINCVNLRKVNWHDGICSIRDNAFQNCSKLADLVLPSELKEIGERAFFNCGSIKEIKIPCSTEDIRCAAFAFMASLSSISVDKLNKVFTTDKDHKALIQMSHGALIQYAIGSSDENYEIDDYFCKTDVVPIPSRIDYICDYAFAGAQNLKELTIGSDLDSVGAKTFMDCPNLKTLNIKFYQFGEKLFLHFINQRFEKCYSPFEKIIIGENVETLEGNQSKIFKNAKEIVLPETIKCIGDSVFTECENLEKICIPSGIQIILPDTFYPKIDLKFQELDKTIKAEDFYLLKTKTEENSPIFWKAKYTKVYAFRNGNYIVSRNGFALIDISKDELKNLSPTSHVIEDKPEFLISYLYDLLSIGRDNFLLVQDYFDNPELRKLMIDFISDIDSVDKLSSVKTNQLIHSILSSHNLNENLFNGYFMTYITKEDLVLILDNFTPSLEIFIKYNCSPTHIDGNIDNIFNHIPALVDYCNLLEKYGVHDRYLLNWRFFVNLDIVNQEKVIKYFNNNLKRLFNDSLVLKNPDHNGYNLKDLIKLCTMLGVFSDDKVLSQRSTTFIIEKMFSEKLSKDRDNEFRIVENKIHRIFGNITLKENINLEFIEFFMENYEELMYIDKLSSGFIDDIYDKFEEIAAYSTSDKGSQRHLKVTIDRCKMYFDSIKNSNLSNSSELVRFLSVYCFDKEFVDKAEEILEEAKKAPRNIFTKVEYDQNNNPIYDYDASHDLKGSCGIAYSYEWLPKQSFHNLVLGKNCNCCAHLKGAGAGIMRASMILDNVQNLVIKNAKGEIIAKMTLWVNKEQGYAIYNNAEINQNDLNKDKLKEIYNAFIAGTKSFLEAYNMNNPMNPINIITIGIRRNELEEFLDMENKYYLDRIDYSKYSYDVNGVVYGEYSGDHDTQALVLKRPNQ